jgi:hypothetical protein
MQHKSQSIQGAVAHTKLPEVLTSAVHVSCGRDIKCAPGPFAMTPACAGGQRRPSSFVNQPRLFKTFNQLVVWRTIGGAAAAARVLPNPTTVRSLARQIYRAVLLVPSSPESSAPLARRCSERCAAVACVASCPRRGDYYGGGRAASFYPQQHTSVGSRVPQTSGRQYNTINLCVCSDAAGASGASASFYIVA